MKYYILYFKYCRSYIEHLICFALYINLVNYMLNFEKYVVYIVYSILHIFILLCIYIYACHLHLLHIMLHIDCKYIYIYTFTL